MIQYFKNFLDKQFCIHDWMVYYETEIWDKFASNSRPVKLRRTLLCKKCGEFKQLYL